jgi:hypothetical protein
MEREWKRKTKWCKGKGKGRGKGKQVFRNERKEEPTMTNNSQKEYLDPPSKEGDDETTIIFTSNMNRIVEPDHRSRTNYAKQSLQSSLKTYWTHRNHPQMPRPPPPRLKARHQNLLHGEVVKPEITQKS